MLSGGSSVCCGGPVAIRAAGFDKDGADASVGEARMSTVDWTPIGIFVPKGVWAVGASKCLGMRYLKRS